MISQLRDHMENVDLFSTAISSIDINKCTSKNEEELISFSRDLVNKFNLFVIFYNKFSFIYGNNTDITISKMISEATCHRVLKMILSDERVFSRLEENYNKIKTCLLASLHDKEIFSELYSRLNGEIKGELNNDESFIYKLFRENDEFTINFMVTVGIQPIKLNFVEYAKDCEDNFRFLINKNLIDEDSLDNKGKELVSLAIDNINNRDIKFERKIVDKSSIIKIITLAGIGYILYYLNKKL